MYLNESIDKVNEQLNKTYYRLSDNDLDMYDFLEIQSTLVILAFELSEMYNYLANGKDIMNKVLENNILSTASIAGLIISSTNSLFILPTLMVILRSLRLSNELIKYDRPNNKKQLERVDKLINLTTYYADLSDKKVTKLLDTNMDDLFKNDLDDKKINSCANILLAYLLNNNIEDLDLDNFNELLNKSNPKVKNKFLNLINKRCNDDIPYINKVKLLQQELFGFDDEKRLRK